MTDTHKKELVLRELESAHSLIYANRASQELRDHNGGVKSKKSWISSFVNTCRGGEK